EPPQARPGARVEDLRDVRGLTGGAAAVERRAVARRDEERGLGRVDREELRVVEVGGDADPVARLEPEEAAAARLRDQEVARLVAREPREVAVGAGEEALHAPVAAEAVEAPLPGLGALELGLERRGAVGLRGRRWRRWHLVGGD